MSRILLQHIRRILPLKQISLLFVVLAFAVTAGFQAYSITRREITIVDGQKSIVVKTMANDVQQVLNQLKVTVDSYDYTNMPLTALLASAGMNHMEIRRAVPMELIVDGQTKKVMTWKNEVKHVFEDEGIILGQLDKMAGATLDTKVSSGLQVQVIRVRAENIKESEPIPYDVLEEPNKTLNEGETLVAQAGIDGQLDKNYRIVYEDGKPVSRTFLFESVSSEPVNRIVEFGTVKNFTNTRGDLVRYSKILDVKATAYTASLADTGKAPGHPAFGITRTGIRAREGVIAVDPRLIPLGTKVYVEVPGAAADYGFAIAADIGSAIKGKLIDLYFDTTSQALRWGRRSVRIYILNEQNDTRWKVNNEPCTK